MAGGANQSTLAPESGAARSIADLWWILMIGARIVLGRRASDRVFVYFGLSYTTQVWFFRVAFFAAPALALALTKRLCEELRAA